MTLIMGFHVSLCVRYPIYNTPVGAKVKLTSLTFKSQGGGRASMHQYPINTSGCLIKCLYIMKEVEMIRVFVNHV